MEITSQEEMDRVEKFLKDADLIRSGLWIGGKYDKLTNKLEWVKSENGFEYTNFAAGEPNKDDSSCISLQSHTMKWQTSDCENTSYLALCEDKDNSGVSISVSVIIFFISLMLTNLYS